MSVRLSFYRLTPCFFLRHCRRRANLRLRLANTNLSVTVLPLSLSQLLHKLTPSEFLSLVSFCVYLRFDCTVSDQQAQPEFFQGLSLGHSIVPVYTLASRGHRDTLIVSLQLLLLLTTCSLLFSLSPFTVNFFPCPSHASSLLRALECTLFNTASVAYLSHSSQLGLETCFRRRSFRGQPSSCTVPLQATLGTRYPSPAVANTTAIAPSQGMEFFDFTGTNDEEKAQAWDVISNRQSTGVEFFFDYSNISFGDSNVSSNTNHNNNNSHTVKSTLYINNNVNGILSPPSVPNNGQHQQQHMLHQPSQPQRPAEGAAAAISFASNQIYPNQNLTFQSQSNWDPNSVGGGNAPLMQQPNCAASPPSMGNLKAGRLQPMTNYSAPSMVFVGPPPPPTGAAMSANGGGSSVQPPTHMAHHPYYPHPPPPAFPHQMQPHALFPGHPHHAHPYAPHLYYIGHDSQPYPFYPPPPHYAPMQQQQIAQQQQTVPPHNQVITTTPPISSNNSQQQITQMTQQPQNLLPVEFITSTSVSNMNNNNMNSNNNDLIQQQQEEEEEEQSTPDIITSPNEPHHLQEASSRPLNGQSLTEAALSCKVSPVESLQQIESSSSVNLPSPQQPTPKSATEPTTTSEEQSINIVPVVSKSGPEEGEQASNPIPAVAAPFAAPPKPSAPVATTWSAKLFGSQSKASAAPAVVQTTHAQAPAASSSSTTSSAPSSAPKPVVVNGDVNNVVSAGGDGTRPTINGGDFPELSSGALKAHSHQQGQHAHQQTHSHPHQQQHQSQNNRNHKNRRSGAQQQQQKELKVTVVPMSEDPVALKLAKKLQEPSIKNSLPTIMPCGLINRGNWCYVNATLQALLACPPFYNLMRDISETPNVFREATSTPIIDNFARFFARFVPADRRQIKMGAAGSNPQTYLEELLNNDAYEPACIYDTLAYIGMIKSDAQRGHQEDAEEFLSSLLNGLHEEMIKLSEFAVGKQNNGADKTNGFAVPSLTVLSEEEDVKDEDPNDDDEDMWHEVVTSKHKALPTRSATVFATAITQIFGGSALEVRTVNSGAGNSGKPASGNRQPFFDLQLDIKPKDIHTLEDALRWQTRRESINGYVDPKTRKVVDAYNQMFLETVPPILVLHLKLFDYDVESGANRKVLKRIEFGENFEIPRDCFLNHGRGRGAQAESARKKYKLLAVVYHSGNEAVKGHYITDVYHLGLNQWLRCDDGIIKVISISQVLATCAGTSSGAGGALGSMVPYLLFYRRQDNNNSGHHPSNSSSTFTPSSSGGNAFSSSNTNNSSHQHHQQSSAASAARHLLPSDI